MCFLFDSSFGPKCVLWAKSKVQKGNSIASVLQIYDDDEYHVVVARLLRTWTTLCTTPSAVPEPKASMTSPKMKVMSGCAIPFATAATAPTAMSAASVLSANANSRCSATRPAAFSSPLALAMGLTSSPSPPPLSLCFYLFLPD